MSFISATCPVVYPDAKRDKTTDVFHGKTIADPYRWMETSSPETKKFIDDKNKLTESFLNKCNDRRKVKEKLTNLWNQTKIGIPKRIGKYYFTFKNTGLQNHDVLYKQTDPKKEPTDVVFDVNQLSKDGSIALSMYQASGDGCLLAYGLAVNGSEWRTIKIRNVDTLQDYKDELKYVRYSSISWTSDNKGFFYSRYSEEAFKTDKLENHTVYYHRVGTTQDLDVLIFNDAKNPLHRRGAIVSDDGRYLLLDIVFDSGNNMFLAADLKKIKKIEGRIQFKTITSTMDASYIYVANIGSTFIIRTNKNAKKFQLVSFDFDNHKENEFWPFIAENPAKSILSARWFNKDKLFLQCVENSQFLFQICWLANGTLIRTISVDEKTITGINLDHITSEIFYACHNNLPPYITYYYDFAKPNENPKKLRERKLKGFDESKFKFEHLEYAGKGPKPGTFMKLPITIIKKEGMKGPKRCLMFGYGGYGVKNAAVLDETVAYFLSEFDGFVAFPTVRGEGSSPVLHEEGRNMKNQNAFSDFQEAARFLVASKYTEHKMITIHGTSHGGLLVTTCLNQAPELFGCAISVVGVMDMLRYHKFKLGFAHTREYGSPDNKTEFENILKYSPLHNIHEPNSVQKQYPPILLLAGENDERAVLCHSLKYTAELQYRLKGNQFQKDPALLRIYKGVGHGDSSSVLQKIEEATDAQTFIHQTLK